MVSPTRPPASTPSIGAVSTVVATVGLLLAAFAIAVVGLGSDASAQADLPSYPDPITGVDVTRLTFDGPDNDGVQCISRIGGLSNGAVSWSLDSSRITFSKSCPDASARNGIWILDVETGAQQCLIGTYRGIWASPTFDHTDDNIYYLDVASQNPDAAFGIYAVAVSDAPVISGDTCPSVGNRELVLDIGGSKSPTRERFTLSKNAARADRNGAVDNAWFAVHAADADGSSGQVGMRTLIFDADRNLHPNWNRSDAANPVQWTYFDDGDSSIWSTEDPLKIYTNRGDGNGNHITGVWNINQTSRPLFTPYSSGDCARSTGQVAHGDWIHHRSTNTDVFIGSGDTRCVWTRQVTNGEVIIEQNSIGLNGYLHININPASIGGSVDDIEFVADTYDLRGGRGGATPQPGVAAHAPMLYEVTVGDMRPGVNESWIELFARTENQLAWHRNNMMYGSDLEAVDIARSGFKPYEPHPQYSPDGRYVLWQSSSLLADSDFPSFVCTDAACGRQGGWGVPERSGVLWTDLYVIDQGPVVGPTPTPTMEPTPTPTPTPIATPGTIELNDLADASDWISWATRGTFGGATVGVDGVTFDYDVEVTGYVAARTREIATNDWRSYRTLDLTYRGQNSGGEVLVLIRRGTVSARLTKTFVDDGTGARTISIPLSDFGDPSTLGNISEIAIQFDETSPNPFELLDLRLVGDNAAPQLFACEVDAAALTWTDHGRPKYWVYKSTDGGVTYSSPTRRRASALATRCTTTASRVSSAPSTTSPQRASRRSPARALPVNSAGATTVRADTGSTFTDPTPSIGARYQVHYNGIPRVACSNG